MNQMLKAFAKRIFPPAFTRRVVKYTRNPPVGRVDFGDLRTVNPISKEWGYDRGQPIDRYYIELFMSRYRAEVKGYVLEVGDDIYTVNYGGGRVTRSDVLHVSADSRKATIVADLRNAEKEIPDNSFDCVICTQTLQYIYEVESAIATLLRILKDSGTLLVTLPGIAQISRYDMEHWGEFWRFTTASAERLFSENRNVRSTDVVSYGNVLSAVAFLNGLAAEELSPNELNIHDPDYQLLIAVRVVKDGA